MKLFKNIGILTIGNFISYGIIFLGIILLSRLYTPEEFGTYAVVLGAASIVSAVSSFRYEMTILLPKRETIAQLALRLSFLTTCLVHSLGLLIILLVVLASSSPLYWLYLPFTSFFFSIINIGSFLQNRHKSYVRIVVVQIGRALLFVLTALLLSWSDSSENSLITAMFISVFFPGLLLLLIDFRRSNAFKGLFRKLQLVFWMKKNSKFFYYSTPAVLLNSLASQAPVFLLTFFMDASVAGYYSIVERVVMAPVILISSAVNKVYMQSITARIANGSQIYPFTTSLIKKFILPSFLISLLMLLIFSFDILEILLGERWKGIDTLSMVMIPTLFVSFVARSISGFAVLNRNELGLIYQAILFLLVSLAVVISTSFSDRPFVVFSAISFSLSLCLIGQAYSILNISQKIDEKLRGKVL